MMREIFIGFVLFLMALALTVALYGCNRLNDGRTDPEITVHDEDEAELRCLPGAAGRIGGFERQCRPPRPDRTLPLRPVCLNPAPEPTPMPAPPLCAPGTFSIQRDDPTKRDTYRMYLGASAFPPSGWEVFVAYRATSTCPLWVGPDLSRNPSCPALLISAEIHLTASDFPVTVWGRDCMGRVCRAQIVSPPP